MSLYVLAVTSLAFAADGQHFFSGKRLEQFKYVCLIQSMTIPIHERVFPSRYSCGSYLGDFSHDVICDVL